MQETVNRSDLYMKRFLDIVLSLIVKNIEILSARILQLVANYSLRPNMGLASGKIAEREFSIESVVEKTLALYE